MLITCKSDIRPPTAPVLGTPIALSTSSLSIPLTTAATDTGTIASYSLERATSSGGAYTEISSSASFPYTDTGLTAATTYYYRSRATDSAGNVGTYSAIVSGTTSSGSVTFTPLIHVNFDGLTDTQAVIGTGSVAGKRWDAVPGNVGFAGGFGMRASTAVARPGKTSSCALSIKSGSDGDPSGGDTGVGMGAFGGYVNLSGANQVSEGQEVWWGAWMFLPTGWSWARLNGGDQVKFERWQHSAGSNHMDIYVLNNSYAYSNGETGSGSTGQQTGWAFRNEYDAKPNADTDFTTSASTGRIPLNQWVWVEQYVYAHSDGTLAKRRLWINGVFVREQVGTAAKWRGNDGTIHTKTVTGGVKTLSTSGDVLTSIAHFTYWNSYAPQDQTMYIGNIVLHKNAADLTATDEFGNKMMGSTAV